MTTQLELLDTERKTRSRVQWLLAIADKRNIDITLASGCCEPGYDDKPVVLANWNSKKRYDRETNYFVTTDDTAPRLAKLFEKLGYETEWEDEWIACEECGKVFRCSPDSYSWQQYGRVSDFGCLCGDCVKSDPSDYLTHLSGNHSVADTLGIDLEANGYVLHHDGYEAGWYDGQNDDPRTIANKLIAAGITNFIFSIDYTSQFQVGFSVWVKIQEETE